MSHQALGAVLLPSWSLLAALVLTAAVVTFLLYAERPAVGSRTVVAFLPWMVAASALLVFAAMVTYPASVRPLVSARGAYLSTYVIAASAWFAITQVSTTGDAAGALADYLGAVGAGAATVLVAFVLMQAGEIALVRLAWLLIAPVLSGFAAGAVLVLLGLWYIDAPAHTGAAGALVVFGQVLDAVTTVLGTAGFGAVGHSPLSFRVMNWVVAAGAPGALGVDRTVVWAGAFVWVKLSIAALAVVLLTRLVRARPAAGYLALGLIAAVGVVSGTTGLFLIAVGGAP